MTRLNVTALIDYELAEARAIDARECPGPAPAADDFEGQRAFYNKGREYWRTGGPEMAAIETAHAPGPDEYAIPLRLYYPVDARPLPAIVFLHGGGWIVGNLDTHDRVMREIAARSGACVVGVDYRLAPEVKFPTPMEDGAAAVHHILTGGEQYGIDIGRVGCAGDSAGGHMTLFSALKLHHRKVTPGLKAMALLYAGVGLRDSQSWRMFDRPEDGMGIADREVWMGCLFEDSCRDRHHPGFDLLQNDLDGLPPAWIMACALDPVLDDSLALAELLQAVGVPARLKIHEGMLHGFIQYAKHMPKARAALQEVGDFFAGALG